MKCSLPPSVYGRDVKHRAWGPNLSHAAVWSGPQVAGPTLCTSPGPTVHAACRLDTMLCTLQTAQGFGLDQLCCMQSAPCASPGSHVVPHQPTLHIGSGPNGTGGLGHGLHVVPQTDSLCSLQHWVQPVPCASPGGCCVVHGWTWCCSFSMRGWFGSSPQTGSGTLLQPIRLDEFGTPGLWPPLTSLL